MADNFENQLREALRGAVPANLEPEGLVEGAKRYAARSRRARLVGSAAGFALILVLALVSTSVLGPRGRLHQAPPAHSTKTVFSGGSPIDCAKDVTTTRAPAKPLTSSGDLTAKLCGMPGRSSVAGGWVLPHQSLQLQQWIAYLREGLYAEDPGEPCTVPAAAVGPPFTVRIERYNGELLSYSSTDLACRGRTAMARYLSAVSLEKAYVDALPGQRVDKLWCGTPSTDLPDVKSAPLPGAGFRRSEGMLCLYPLYSANDPGTLTLRTYRRIFLTRAQMKVINDDLRNSTLHDPKGMACTPLTWFLTLRMSDPGDANEIGLQGACTDRLDSAYYHLAWQPPQATQALLASLIPKQ